MSLLLCRRKAEHPFKADKLNIRIWTEQELCYYIYNYPLFCLSGFIDEKLFDWIDTELKLTALSESLRRAAAMGDSVENQMLRILQSGNYYDVKEIMEFGSEVAEYRKLSAAELARREGRLLFDAGKYSMAKERFTESLSMLDEDLKSVSSGEQTEPLLKKKASAFCDRAACRLQMTDEEGAVSDLISSEVTYYNKRAVRMRYLIDGTGELTEEERDELDDIRERALSEARESPGYKYVTRLFEGPRDEALEEAGALLAMLKNNYRKM